MRIHDSLAWIPLETKNFLVERCLQKTVQNDQYYLIIRMLGTYTIPSLRVYKNSFLIQYVVSKETV